MLKSLTPPGRFIGNVIALLTGNLLSQILLFFVTPVLTRLYTPEDFGLMAIVASIAGSVRARQARHYYPICGQQTVSVTIL